MAEAWTEDRINDVVARLERMDEALRDLRRTVTSNQDRTDADIRELRRTVSSLSVAMIGANAVLAAAVVGAAVALT